MPYPIDPVTGQPVIPYAPYLSPETQAMMNPPAIPTAIPTPMPPQGYMPQPVAPISTGQPGPMPPPTLSPSPGNQTLLADAMVPPAPVPTPATPKPTHVSGAEKYTKESSVGGAPAAPKAAGSSGGGDYGFGASVKKEQAAIKTIGNVEAAKSLSEADIYEKAVQRDQELEAERIEKQQAWEKQSGEDLRHAEEMNAKIGEPINARRYWQKKSGFEKVGAALAIAMGAMGDALMQIGGVHGQGNQALNIIQSQIDQDIDEQKANSAQAKTKADAAYNVYRMNLDHYKNEEAAVMATKANYWEQVRNRIATIGAGAASKEAQSKSEMLSEQAGQKASEYYAKLEELRLRQAQINAAAAKAAKTNPAVGGMFHAEKEIEELYQKGQKKPDYLFTSTDEQRWEGAKDRWAINFAKSQGMRVTPDSLKQIKKSYFPGKLSFSGTVDSFRNARQSAFDSLAANPTQIKTEGETDADQGF